MSIRLRQSIKKTSRGGLKMKTRGFIIGSFALALVLVATGANAYVGYWKPQPEDFSFVNNIGTLTWYLGAGSTNTVNIDVVIYAPDNDSDNFGISYNDYKTLSVDGTYSDNGGAALTTDQTYNFTSGTHNVNTESTNFDDAYGYFYTISLGTDWDGDKLSSFEIDLGPATITEIGYVSGTGDVDPTSAYLSDLNTITFNWGTGLTSGQTSDQFYMASEYWRGWTSPTFGGTGVVPQEGGGYNNSGNLPVPAPNPEAPTVALFMLGIFGLHVWRNKGLRFMANSQ